MTESQKKKLIELMTELKAAEKNLHEYRRLFVNLTTDPEKAVERDMGRRYAERWFKKASFDYESYAAQVAEGRAI